MSFDPGTEADLADERAPRLSDEQRAVHEAVMSAVHSPTKNPRGNGFYVDGPGGSGKTYFMTEVVLPVYSRYAPQCIREAASQNSAATFGFVQQCEVCVCSLVVQL